MAIPAARVRLANDKPVRPTGAYVLYWMIAHRRLRSNFALERAVDLAVDTRRPLIVFEPLAVDYAWASDRLHQFVIEGMADHARQLAGTPALYVPHVERAAGDGRRLLDALAREASVIVTDDYPAFFLPDAIARVADRLDVRVEAVDSNGLLPMRADMTPCATAMAFRARMQRTLRTAIAAWPGEINWSSLPSAGSLWAAPAEAPRPTAVAELESADRLIAQLPLDHSVAVTKTPGGESAARRTLDHFVATGLTRYADAQRHPDLHGTSGLSPYLHFGHISAHDVFEVVMSAERWTSVRLGATGGGRREGWWGASPSSEAFLDQLVTWRELGFHGCASDPRGYDQFAALPAWAQRTLNDHASDPRPVIYTREELDAAGTHDEVWNAAQRQLTRDGWMHGYLRMLWGKKILEWSPSPEEALETMIQIMNRYALDGRDPNSYTGYLWTLGRYDRPWAPARPIFGTVRYMSSDNTKRKLKMKAYLARYAARHE